MTEELVMEAPGEASFEHWPSRQTLMAHRRARSLSLGPSMRLQFEDAWTVRHQVREVLRVEGITDARAIRHEMQTYSHWLPDGTRWQASLLIELPDARERARDLPVLSAAAHRVYLTCATATGLEPAYATANDDLPDRHLGRPSAVHFLRFDLPAAMREQLLAGAPATIGCSHERYPWRQVVPPDLLRRLRRDLEPVAASIA